MIKSLELKDKDNIYFVLIGFCKKYEELCSIKYLDAPLPLEILKSINSQWIEKENLYLKLII